MSPYAIAGEVAVNRFASEESPLSIGQERQVLAEEYARICGQSRPSFNLVNCRRVQGTLNLAAFERAVDRLIARHEALRSVLQLSTGLGEHERREAAEFFGRTGLVRSGFYVQATQPTAAVDLRVRDVARLSSDRRLCVVSDLMTDELGIAFDYDRVPLLRTHVLRVSPEEHVIVLAMPHWAGDTISTQVCWRDLWRLYEADSSGADQGALGEPLQYPAFARDQRDALRAGAVSSSVDYWRRQWAVFEDAQLSPEELPGATHLGSPMGPAVQTLKWLGPQMAVRIRQLARRLRATPFTICLSAFAALLCVLTARSRVAVWVPFGNRVQPRTESAVGLFAQYHMIGLDVERCGSWRDLVLHCRAQTMGALSHQQMPLAVLWQMLGRRAERAHLRVAFDWHARRFAAAASGLTIDPVPVSERCVFPQSREVSMRMFDEGQSLRVGLMYNRRELEPGAVAQMLERYQQMLEAICDDADAAVPRGWQHAVRRSASSIAGHEIRAGVEVQ